MTEPTAATPDRLRPYQARAVLLAIVQSDLVAPNVREVTERMMGLDAWPPKDPRALALDILDNDTPAITRQIANVLLALDAHRHFEAGRTSIPLPDVTIPTTGLAKQILRVVGSCLRLGNALDEDAVLPSLEDFLRPYIENEARLAVAITRIRDCLYPGGSGAEEHGGEEASTVNNILREMGFGPTDGRDGPDDAIDDEDTDEGE